MVKYLKITFLFTLFFLALKVKAHPTGNLIVVGEYVLWSYIDPIEDKDHHACVMIWKEGAGPKPLITSKFPASDFMIYAKNETIYLLERKFVSEKDSFEVRVLKLKLNGETEEIWPWFEDEWRIGEGGFSMLSDKEIIFCNYPEILQMKKGETPMPFFRFDHKIKRMRFLNDDSILLLSDERCWLSDSQGNVLEEWENLTTKSVQAPPLGRNQIFDVDYKDGKLLLAYWGKRCFYRIDENGNRKIIEQLKAPETPHWVAFRGNEELLFASQLIFDGSTPRPRLVMIKNGKSIDIWVRD